MVEFEHKNFSAFQFFSLFRSIRSKIMIEPTKSSMKNEWRISCFLLAVAASVMLGSQAEEITGTRELAGESVS